ncbi:MAG: hypothetical protein ACQEQL_08810 [Pseudomonadota bacterium]
MTLLTRQARQLRIRFRDDFGYYARKCLFIRQKSGTVTPFVLNAAQRYIHDLLEKQLEQTGQVRALIVKGRQQGCSTYVEGRFFWKITHRTGVRAFIMSHLESASRNLADVVQRFYSACPVVMRPSLTRSNQKTMEFGVMDSGYKIGTARSKGAGRSDTLQYFHGSEVAYWVNARQHISGILQSIPKGQGTEIILESTSDGPQGLFYEMCMAARNNKNGYQLIFVPWFWQEEYQSDPPPGFSLTADEQRYADTYGLSDAQMLWRREKTAELGGHWMFRREYPASLNEAFHSDTPGALWTRAMIARNRVPAPDCPEFTRMVVAVDPAVTKAAQSDETGMILAALGVDGDAYILQDLSGKYSPAEWAAKAVEAYHQYGADRIVIEANQGGDMALHTLRTADPLVPVKKVHASRGKWTRAEPIAALDEQNRIHHVGDFPVLEDQMCGFKPGDMRHSPDRVDARVWALSELLLSKKTSPPKIWHV